MDTEATTLASGDDEGLIKLWDIRQQKAIATLQAHSDFVSDLFYSSLRYVCLIISHRFPTTRSLCFLPYFAALGMVLLIYLHLEYNGIPLLPLPQPCFMNL